MRPELKVFHRGLILVGVPFLLGLTIICGLAFLLYQSDQEQLNEAKYRKIAAVNARILMLASELPYYLISSIRFRSDEIFKVYQSKHEQVLQSKQKMMNLLLETPDLSDGAEQINRTLGRVIAISEEIAESRKAHLPDLLIKLGRANDVYQQEKGVLLERLAKLLRAGEIRTVEMQKQQALIRFRQSQILVWGLLANLLAAVVLALFFRGGIASRLRVIKANTIALSKNESLNKPLAGSDEIARLDQAFHAMDKELREAQERERELFDNASDVICVLDYQNKFSKVNLACQRVWGYSPETLRSMTLDDLLDADELNGVYDQIAHGKLSGEAFSFESKLKKSDGSEIEVFWSSFWSQIDRQLYCVVHDISERKASERMKQKFLSIISSDLKRPLSTMSGAISILLGSMSENLSKNTISRLEMAGKNLQRLLGLVNDLLQVAEMDSASIDIKKEWCDSEEPLVRSVQEVQALAEKRNIKLEVLPCHTKWLVDPNRIVQVLVNLLSNAIKFSPDGGTVTLSSIDRGDMIEVRVQDQGRGVPESHKEAIFEKFKQVEAADGKRKAGTGLGLPICKQIVEDHGGDIGVDSITGQGSTFWFRVPRDETVSLRLRLQKRKTQDDSRQAAGEGTLAAGMPGAGMPGAGMPGAGMPGAGMPGAGMPGAGMPGAGMPGAGMPGAGMPGAGMPGAGTAAAGTSVAGTSVAGTSAAGTSAMVSAVNNALARPAQRDGFAGRIKLAYKGALLVCVPLIFELVFVGNINSVLMQVDRERKLELHYRNIAFETTRLINMYFLMVIGAVSDNNETDWMIFHEGYLTANKTLEDLKRLVKRDPVAAKLVAAAAEHDAKIGDWVRRGEKVLEKHPDSYKAAMGGKERAVPFVIKVAHRLEALCSESEKRELTSPEKQKILRTKQAQILLLGLLANIGGSIMLAMFFASDIVSRLQILADNAMRLAKEQELNKPLAGADEIAELDATFHDTARALSESRKKERAVFTNSQDVICSLDKEGNFASVNPAAEKVWGYSMEELMGKPLSDFVLPEQEDILKAMLAAEADQHLNSELAVRSKSGAIVHCRWSYSRKAESQILHCVVHDITSLKELEQIKQEFLAMVSHDLRTPLTAVLGVSKLILAGAFGAVDEKASKMLNTISKSGDHLLELINDLLDIEKLEAGKMQLMLSELWVEDICDRAFAACRDSERVSLKVHSDCEEAKMNADEDRLVQALVNILNFSIDRLHSGAKKVEFSCLLEDGAVIFSVEDSAPLLSAEQRLGLFDRFKTFENAPKEAQSLSGSQSLGGSQLSPAPVHRGLGLPIARKIVEEHGGVVEAIEKDGLNVLRFRIPVAVLKQAAAD